MLKHTPQALVKAKQLRQQQTQVEQLLWSKLRHRQLAGLKFRRQVPIGAYIVDFYCHERRLVVELDGGQHLQQLEYDHIRTQFLQAQGLTVLRFWNNDILTNIVGVLQRVADCYPHSNSLPQGERTKASLGNNHLNQQES